MRRSSGTQGRGRWASAHTAERQPRRNRPCRFRLDRYVTRRHSGRRQRRCPQEMHGRLDSAFAGNAITMVRAHSCGPEPGPYDLQEGMSLRPDGHINSLGRFTETIKTPSERSVSFLPAVNTDRIHLAPPRVQTKSPWPLPPYGNSDISKTMTSLLAGLLRSRCRRPGTTPKGREHMLPPPHRVRFN